MRTHTGEDPEIYQIWTQSQAKQDDWPEETWKKCPVKVIRGHDSPSEPARVSLFTRTLFTPNKHFICFPTFHLFVEIHFCLWWSSG